MNPDELLEQSVLAGLAQDSTSPDVEDARVLRQCAEIEPDEMFFAVAEEDDDE